MGWWAAICALGGAGLLVAAARQAAIGQVGLASVIMTGGPISNLLVLMLAAAVVAVVALAALTLPQRRKGPPQLLIGIAVAAPALTLLSSGREWMIIQQTAARLHVTDPRIPAPSLAEAFLVAGLGAVIGALAAGLFTVVRARAQNA
jgi:hypothetical protein